MVAAAASALVLLHGIVTIGPTSPVCKVGTPCSKPSPHTYLQFARVHPTPTSAGAEAWTDARGHYQVKLAPGEWMVVANRGFAIKPVRFWVRAVPTLTRNFKLDSGIR
jgi:hypothetical protein